MNDITNLGLFISHHSSSSAGLVKEVSKILDALGITHWYAERDIKPGENYTYIIPQVIKKCDSMVLLLNNEANNSEQVLREIQYATELKIPLLIFRLDDCVISDSIKYIGSTVQHADLRGFNKVILAQTIGETIQSWKKDKKYIGSSKVHFQHERAENCLDFFADDGERTRLQNQHNFIYEFAAKHYDKFISELENGSFLDVGCNTGEQSMMFLEGRKEVTKYVGIDRELDAIEKGRELYPNAQFYHGNIESDEFDDLLSDIEEELNIDGFDIINISMVILHMKEPQLLLDILSDHLAENGRIVILDIDDGLSMAYPDPDDLFAKAVELCAETEYSGYRKSGRQILKLLSDVDLSNIELLEQGFSTVGMNREKRSDFFDLYFWFILDDLRKMHESAPNDKIIETHLIWMEEHYKEMRTSFKKKDFYFNLGFMLYSGKM